MQRAVIVLLLCALAPGVAFAQGAPKEQKGPANPVAAAYAAMPVADRITLQTDLIWTGDYNGIANGEFGERSIAAVRVFQKRNGGKETGLLSAAERTALATAAKGKQDAVGWRLAGDAPTGTRLGLPGKLVGQMTPTKTGTRFAAARDAVVIETFRVSEPGISLLAVRERERTEPGRKIDYDVLRPDFFVLSGLQGDKKLYVRAHGREGEVRGFTIVYDRAQASVLDPVVVAMSSTFAPFATAAVPRKPKVEYASGTVIDAAGHVLTDRQATEGCFVLTVAGLGNADQVAEDKVADLALLKVHGAPDLKPAALAAPGSTPTELTLAGIADPSVQAGGSAVTTARVRLAGTSVEPSPAQGFSGAAALDPQGRLIGMVALRSKALLVPGDTIRGFLEREKLSPGGAGAADLAAAQASVVRVICVRK